jgi:ATP-dependent RNA helicase DeaD
MLEMGFIEDVEWILEHAPENRQIALFSATLPAPIRRVAQRHLREPADVRIAERQQSVPGIEQLSLRVRREERLAALERLLGMEEQDAVLVFTGTQRAAGELAEHLAARGVQAECVHGGIGQAQREAVVKRLRSQRTQIVVATDVAARGLDVEHIGLVVNYDLPRSPEGYVHRIGRTGRAGRAGRAITFWAPRELKLLQSIERFVGKPMQPLRLPGRAELVAERRERFAERLLALARSLADAEGAAGAAGSGAASEPGAHDPAPAVPPVAHELSGFLALARRLAAAGAVALEHLAAAATRLAWGDGPLALEAEAPHREPRAHHDETDAGERSRERPRGKPGRRGLSPDEVTLVFPVGTWSKVRPGDLVGAIAGETGLPGKIVGNIHILERVSFVSIPAEHVETVLRVMDGKSIRGRVVHPRRADPERPQHERPPKRRRPVHE